MNDSFEVKNEAVQQQMRELAKVLHEEMYPNYGFALFILSHGEEGATFYISDIEREGMINALKEFIRKHEAKGV